MTGDNSSDTRCGIGARLRAGRERTGMTVLQAAEKLHIDPKMLEALETERFEGLGAPVFVRGHLKNYADLIGEPIVELQRLFEASFAGLPPDLRRTVRMPRVFDRRKLIKPSLFVLIAFALACAAWWVLTRRGH